MSEAGYAARACARGLCTYEGCVDPPEPGFRRCAVHRALIRTTAARRVRRYRRRGFCRCGQYRKPGRKHCKKCLAWRLDYQISKVEEWVIAGLCRCCGEPPEGISSSGRLYKTCAVYRSKLRDRWNRTERKRRRRTGSRPHDPDVALRVAKVKARWRLLGHCITCGKKVESTNARTGLPCSMCDHHLELASTASVARRMRRKRARSRKRR